MGVISVMSNAFPRVVSRICELYFSGLHEESLALQVRSLDLIRALLCETNPSPIKHVMAALGYCADEVRLPLDKVSAASAKLIDAATQKFMEKEK